MKNRVVEAARGVFQLRLGWSCAYVLRDGREFMMVDTGTVHDRHLLARELARLGLNPARCRGVLLTHAHCDHAGNAASLRALSGASVGLHSRETAFLQGRSYASSVARPASRLAFRLGELFAPVAPCPADSLLREGDEVPTPAGTWRVLETPGHTPGHVCLWRERDGVLLSGDALLNVHSLSRRAGLTLPLPLFASQRREAKRSARTLATLPVRALLPGHGPPLLHDAQAKLRHWARAAG